MPSFGAALGRGSATTATVGSVRRRGGGNHVMVTWARGMTTSTSTSRRMTTSGVDTVDPRETAKFEADAARWWDEEAGPFAPLHTMNPVRVGFVRDALVRHFGFAPGTGGFGEGGFDSTTETKGTTVTGSGAVTSAALGAHGTPSSPLAPRHPAQPLAGLRLLDVGCGGGILCEALARLGADVTGIDAAPGNIAVATAHAALDPDMARGVTYHAAPAEELLATGASFDAVVSLEVIEHVNDPEAFVRCLAGLTKPGGALVLSTLNRSARSYAMAILAAEQIMAWVPRGTHDFGKFLTPAELGVLAGRAGLEMEKMAGMTYSPPAPRLLTGLLGAPRTGSGATGGTWQLGDDTSVNYIASFSKPRA